jgi:flagellar hook-associated protein 2
MSISFGGLATGLDTNSLVTQLLQMEKRPLTRLENDKAWNSSRLAALGQFESKLLGFLQKLEDLDSATEVQPRKATLSAEGFFKATASTEALPGSYQVEVVSLAQVEKEVSQGYADKAARSFGTGTIFLTVGDGEPIDIAIDAENNSLEGMMKAINDAGAGVTASIINDGTSSPHRLVLTGDEVAKAITLEGSELAGGTYAKPAFTETQTGLKAHVRVDGIDIYGTANTIKDAIPGVTLDLTKAEEGTKTSLSVTTDEAAIKKKIQGFVSGYNDVVSFVTKQSVINGSSGGILKGDSGLHSIKTRLQNLLVTPVPGGGALQTFSQLGLATQKDGTLKLDDAVLTKAIQENLGDVAKVLAGAEGAAGVATGFRDYLKGVTDSTDGFYAGRKKSIDSNLKQIDKSIEQTNARLAQRENSLRKQFKALEKLVSAMNSQSAYITQQMTMLNNLWSRD